MSFETATVRCLLRASRSVERRTAFRGERKRGIIIIQKVDELYTRIIQVLRRHSYKYKERRGKKGTILLSSAGIAEYYVSCGWHFCD